VKEHLYTSLERNVLTVVDLVGPATVDVVIEAVVGPNAAADARAGVREVMQRLAVLGDIVGDADGWRVTGRGPAVLP
jgi:F420-dependent methylenetetrahydromethanopterin dehydrogenase